MSDSKATPHARFVEAMRFLDHRASWHHRTRCVPCQMVRQAAEAFADAECGDRLKAEAGWARIPIAAQRAGVSAHDHAACHAALLKEIGL